MPAGAHTFEKTLASTVLLRAELSYSKLWTNYIFFYNLLDFMIYSRANVYWAKRFRNN